MKKNNLCHFKKVNLIGASNTGKKTLLKYIQHYADKNIDFEIEKNQETKENASISLVETIIKISIPYYEAKKLDINLYISKIEKFDFIKENLDILLSNSECVIFMIDISSLDSFSLISEIMPLINKRMKKNIEYGDIPFFFISNKIDLEENREVSGFEIKEMKDKYPNINDFEISLNLKKNENNENVNQFIVKLCTTISEAEKKYSFRYDSLNLVKIREPMNLLNESNIIQRAENTLNFLVLGASKVGKTSFAQRLFNNEFNENNLSTIGIDVIRTIGELYGNLVKIELWDTAGQEKLRSIPKRYYSKADGFFMIYDVTDRKSFEDIVEWIKDIRATRGSEEDDFQIKSSDEVMVLIGNKIDKTEERKVTKQEGYNLAKKYDIKYYESSCKQGINIYEIFCDVIFESSSKNRREATNFVLNRRKTKIKNLYHPKKKKCC